MSTVIVTGSGGLIGSEAVAHFVRAGHDVVGIENDMREDDKKDQNSTQEAQDAALKADQIQQSVFQLQENKTRDEQYAIQAMADAQRIGIVSGFNEIAVDTLALELADLALTSTSTDRSLNGLFLAYRGTTGYRPGSAMELFHDGQSIGWYNKAGLVWGVVR